MSYVRGSHDLRRAFFVHTKQVIIFNKLLGLGHSIITTENPKDTRGSLCTE